MNVPLHMTFVRPFLPFFCHMCGNLYKIAVLTVNMRCLMGLNLDWVKSYGLKCSLRHRASSVNSQKIATDKQPFFDHIWAFFATYMFIFHKTEMKTVILRCLTSLNHNWYNRYDTKRKNAKTQMHVFVQNCNTPKMEIPYFLK